MDERILLVDDEQVICELMTMVFIHDSGIQLLSLVDEIQEKGAQALMALEN